MYSNIIFCFVNTGHKYYFLFITIKYICNIIVIHRGALVYIVSQNRKNDLKNKNNNIILFFV